MAKIFTGYNEVSEDLEVFGDLQVPEGSALEVHGDIEVEGDLHVDGIMEVFGDLRVSGIISGGGSLQVGGEASASATPIGIDGFFYPQKGCRRTLASLELR